MPIERDLSDLPKASADRSGGWAPDPQPRFGRVLSQAWLADERARDSDRLARFRHSDAGGCARALAYAALDVPETDPIDEAGVFVTRQGQNIHEAWQQALVAMYGDDAEVEVKVVADKDGRRERGGHIDAVVTLDHFVDDMEEITRKISIEGKSVGGYRYKSAIGCPPAARTPQGPQYDHILQAALNAKGVDADEAVVIYWTREAISKEMAARQNIDELRRIIAEWTIDRETYMALADKEISRIERVMEVVDGGELPRRVIPDPELPHGHLIVQPRTGSFVVTDDDGMTRDAGKTWHCNYCRWQTLCDGHPAERVAITEVNLALP